MTTPRRILTWPKRRWRARGFGIHSPFAYSFVTTVLGKRSIDNNNAELRAIAGKNYRRYARIYRCIKHFKPQSVFLYPIDDPTLTRIVNLANPATTILSNDTEVTTPDMTIIASTATSPCNLPDNSAEVYYIDGINSKAGRNIWEQVTATRDYGMDFSNYRVGIMCRFKHLPRQSFKIAIK